MAKEKKKQTAEPAAVDMEKLVEVITERVTSNIVDQIAPIVSGLEARMTEKASGQINEAIANLADEVKSTVKAAIPDIAQQAIAGLEAKYGGGDGNNPGDNPGHNSVGFNLGAALDRHMPSIIRIVELWKAPSQSQDTRQTMWIWTQGVQTGSKMSKGIMTPEDLGKSVDDIFGTEKSK